MTGLFQWTVRVTTDTMNQLTSVERLLYYVTELEMEGVGTPVTETVPQEWPSEGGIKFEKTVARYHKTFDPVLRGISVKIRKFLDIGRLTVFFRT